MELRDRAALLALRGELAEDVDVRDIEDLLIRDGLIDNNDKQLIHKVPTTKQQTSMLIDILVGKKDPRAFKSLLSGLEQSSPFLSKKLEDLRQNPQKVMRKDCKDYATVFIEGGIPIAPHGNIELKYIAELKQHLVSLSTRSDGGWILVRGRGGAGKSVMVAQAIRGSDYLSNPIAAYFFNRVFWFTIGNLRREEWKSLLLTKMQTICIRLDPTVRSAPPENLDRAKDLLRSIMLNKYPCGLLVLDDVWEPEILRYFNVEARTVVTSRNADIFSRIQRGHPDRCKEISVNEGLLEDSTIKLLTEMVLNSNISAGQVSDQFSEEDLRRIKKLHTKCKGNPFIISIFGGLLLGRVNQFERYLKKFEENMFKNVSVEAGDYAYTSIKDAILVSVDDLDSVDKERYLQLAIFPEDSFLSARFLSTYCWRDDDDSPLPEEDARDVIDRFVRRSIATRELCHSDTPLLTLHDLIVGALKNEYREKRTGYNNQFVDRVLHQRGTKSSWLEVEDDFNYLAYSFVYHLVGANVISLAKKLSILCDFGFIAWLCCRIGADNLAFLYQYSMKVLKISNGLLDFVAFFRSPIFRIQATYLAIRRSDSAVIQLALTLPEDNHVRRCAEVAVKSHKQFFCFYAWLNHDQTEEQIYKTMTVDCDIVSFALDRDFKHAVVASESSAVVLDLQSETRTYRVCKEDILAVEDKQSTQENVQVVAALFSPNNDSLLVLTEYALFRFMLEQSAFATGVRPSPALPPPSEGSNLHFPEGRPTSAMKNAPPIQAHDRHVYVKESTSDQGSYFTAMCFYAEARLVLGSNNGEIRLLTLVGKFINCSSDFFIDSEVSTDSKINHIAVSGVAPGAQPQVSVSGPNQCVYVFEKRYSIKKYSGHQCKNPLQCAFEPGTDPRFAASIAENEIHLWNPRTQAFLGHVDGPRNTSFTSIAISPDGVYIAVGTSTRAHIYLYRVLAVTESSASLQFVDELNGSGSYIKSLTFATFDQPFLYSVSEMSTEGVLTRWHANLSTTPVKTESQNNSSAFFGLDNSTLRLRTVFDAVTVGGDIIVACQSVRKSLLILKSADTKLCTIESGKFSADAIQQQKASTIRIAPSGKFAVFTFFQSIIVAEELYGRWTFTGNDESFHINDVVFLPSHQEFVGCDRNCNFVLYRGNICIQRAEIQHMRLLSIEAGLFDGAHALALSDRCWRFISADLTPNYNSEGSVGDTLPDNLLCCDSCLLQHGYVAAGSDLGSLMLWRVNEDGTTSVVEVLSRHEDESANLSLRCVKFSHRIREDFCLLAGAFDDNKFSLWALKDGRLIDLIRQSNDRLIKPVQIGTQLLPSEIGCIAWAEHTEPSGARHHKLLIASDCVHVCCLPEQAILASLQSGGGGLAEHRPVSLYSRQSVMKAQILGDGHDLLFIDNSHTVFLMRTLHSAGQLPIPEIPLGHSSEQS